MPQKFETHEITNQAPPFVGQNLLLTNAALHEALIREGGKSAVGELTAFGQTCGSEHVQHLAYLANREIPRLETHDAQGRRRDAVEFNRAYHDIMEISVEAGLHCRTWDHLGAKKKGTLPAANVIRATGFYLAAQMEPGHCCPISMTHAVVPALQTQPDLSAVWLPRILSRTYDPTFRPATEKSGVLFGMGMTEKQGGTDVAQNATRAEPIGLPGPGKEYRIVGHKWFLSAPMCDAFLILAQAHGGLSCFLLPRFRQDGSVNALRLQRLKDKLGNRSNASSEVEFKGASAWLVGEEGSGVRTIIEMVTRTRLDCAVSSAALMRQAVTLAIHHARHRRAFGKLLADHVLMTEVLADLALDAEAATALVMRLARAFDRAEDERARAWARLMTPVVKYWVCKMAPAHIAEAMECLGGNGYVENSPMARIYREAPVNAIWEGAGNVMALDVLRVLQREPDIAAIVLDDLRPATQGDAHLAAGLERIETILQDARHIDRRARLLVESLALVAAGSILRAHAPAYVADAFIASRLSGLPRTSYGQGIDWADTRAILERALPPTA